MTVAAIFSGCRTESDSSNLNSGATPISCADLESRVLILQSQINQSKAGKDAILDPFNSGMALVASAASTPATNSVSQPSSTAPTTAKPVATNSAVNPITTASNTFVPAVAVAQPQNSVLSGLQTNLAEAQAKLKKCYDLKFGQTKTPPPTSGNQGHCDFKDQPYDILNYNCHSAANESVRDQPKTTGIVSCNGLAPFRDSPAHHTFNYRVEGTSIVYYNWGKTCSAPKTTVPPDLLDRDHMQCAQEFCGDQYQVENTQAFDPGMLVEEPGPQFCSNHPAVTSADQCNSCCQFRGKYWDRIPNNLRPNDATFINFSSQCFSSCSAKFRTIR